MTPTFGSQVVRTRENHESLITVKFSSMFTLNQLKRLAMHLLAVMLLAVSAPTISKLIVMHGEQSTLMEICTAEGIQRISLTDAGLNVQDSSGGQHVHAEECPYCHLQLNPSIPPSTLMVLNIDVLAFFPTLFYQAPKAQFVWAPQRARAPPVLS